jgi:PAS domain S-box-containing protein
MSNKKNELPTKLSTPPPESSARTINCRERLVWILSHETLVSYSFAVVAVAAGMGLRLTLTAWFGPGLPTFITFYPMVMLVALLAGFWPGMLATVVSSAVVVHWILAPVRQWAISTPIDRVALALFIGMGLFVSLVAELYRSNRGKAAAYDMNMALRESDERFHQIIESLPTAVYTTDTDGHITHYNPATIQLMGLVPELGSDKLCVNWKLYRPDGTSLAHNECSLGTEQRGGGRYGAEAILERSDGTRSWVMIYPQQLLYCKTGKVMGDINFLEDITERKCAEDRLHESQKENSFLADLIRTSEKPMAVGYPDGRLGLTNAAFETLTGYSTEELQGINWAAVLTPPEWLKIEQEKLSELLRTGRPVRYEKEYIRKNGTRVPIELLAHIKTDLKGKPEFYYAFVTDITERKKTEKNLDRLNHTLQAFSRSGRALIYATEEAAYLQEVCRIIVEDCGHAMVWIGFAENDATKTVRPVASYGFEEGYLDTLHISWADTERGRGPTGTAIRTGQVSQCRDMLTDLQFAPWREEAIKRGYASSTVFPLLIDGRTIGSLTLYSREPAGFPDDEVQLLTELTDDLAFGITTLRLRAAHILTERILRENEQRMRLATEATSVGIWEWNLITNQIHWDTQMFQIYGVAPTTDGFVPYATWSSSVFPEDLLHQEQEVQKCIRLLKDNCREFRIRRANDGQCRHIQAVETVLTNALGEAELLVGTNLDVTERKLDEQALKDADRRKDEFLALLAHELRNPLAPIRNVVEIQKLANMEPSRIAWCNAIIERQVEHLTRLVDDLLDVSRISRGLVDLKKEPLEIRDFFQLAVETSQPMIDARRHTFTMTLPTEPLWVEGDRIRLAQVVSNLITNAAKYTDEGGHIELSVEPAGDEVCIRVTDNGCGIDPVDLPSLFDLFYQVSGHIDRSQGGLGIGLSLVQRLVAEHGGHVRAISAGRGRGSEFEVRLPRLIPCETVTPLATTPTASTQKRRILLVDDNHDVAESLAMLLEFDGHQVLIAHEGTTALEIARAERPDIILLDIGLPGMNGYLVAKEIRLNSELAQTMLIALTGYGQLQDREKSRAAGFDAHLVKPIDYETLRKLLAEHANLGESPAIPSRDINKMR